MAVTKKNVVDDFVDDLKNKPVVKNGTNTRKKAGNVKKDEKKLPEKEKDNVNDVPEVSEKAETEVAQKKKETKPKKTSMEVYGYHWMGQIFGE